jgi:hypothetical protein
VLACLLLHLVHYLVSFVNCTYLCCLSHLGEDEIGQHLPFINRVELDKLAEEFSVEDGKLKNAAVKIRYFMMGSETTKNMWQNAKAVKTGEDLVSPSSPGTFSTVIAEDVLFVAPMGAPVPDFILPVGSLTAFLTDHVIFELENIMKNANLFSEVRSKSFSRRIELPDKVETTTGRFEYVADVNGLAIPAMLEFLSSATCTMYSELARAGLKGQISQQFRDLPKPKDMNIENPSQFLKLAAVYQAGGNGSSYFIFCPPLNLFVSIRNRIPRTSFLNIYTFFLIAGLTAGFIAKVTQLKATKYNWLKSEISQQCVDRLAENIPDRDEATFEVLVEHAFYSDVYSALPGPAQMIVLQGLLDIQTSTTIWEIKCVNQLQLAHRLQLSLYAWLCKKTREDTNFQYRLLNVVTNECLELNCNDSSNDTVLDEMVGILVTHYFRSTVMCNDQAFVDQHTDVLKDPKLVFGGVRSPCSSMSPSPDPKRKADGVNSSKPPCSSKLFKSDPCSSKLFFDC